MMTIKKATPSKCFRVNGWGNMLHAPDSNNRRVRDDPGPMDNGPNSTTPFCRQVVVSHEEVDVVADVLAQIVRPAGV